MRMTYLKRIAAAVPERDMRNASIVLVTQMLTDPRQQSRSGRLCLGDGCEMPILFVGPLRTLVSEHA